MVGRSSDAREPLPVESDHEAVALGSEDPTWVVANVDHDARTAAYVYVVPGHRAVLVDVAAEARKGDLHAWQPKQPAGPALLGGKGQRSLDGFFPDIFCGGL